MTQLKNDYKHWKLDQDNQGVLWLSLDRENSSANTLSQEVINELGQLIEEIEHSPAKALIIRSAKKSGFIFGADLNEISKVTQHDDLIQVLRNG